MTYRRAAIPALIGGLILAALLWWAGASTQALHLPGTGGTLGDGTAAELERRLSGVRPGAETSGGTGDTATSDSGRYRALYETGLRIRFGALFVLFALGALLLVRGLPPVRGRTTAAFLAVWAWGAVAGALAVTVSTPWPIAAAGHGGHRFLPQVAGAASSPNRATSCASGCCSAVGPARRARRSGSGSCTARDALVLVVVRCALRWLPGLLTRATVPATAAVTVRATVPGLLLSQAVRIALSPESPYGASSTGSPGSATASRPPSPGASSRARPPPSSCG